MPPSVGIEHKTQHSDGITSLLKITLIDAGYLALRLSKEPAPQSPIIVRPAVEIGSGVETGSGTIGGSGTGE